MQRSLFVCTRAAGIALLLSAITCGDNRQASDVATDAAPNQPVANHFAPPVLDVPVFPGAFDVAAALDSNPDPRIVELTLEARVADVEISPGRIIKQWTYNGRVPGPRIEASQGDTVRIHFTNSLPDATTIHWHGLRIPNAMDGVPVVQAPILPGTTFTYEFVVPDAGTFWYHPHVQADEQVERGLYGAFVVHGPNEPVTTSDHTVVFDDILVDNAWQLAPFTESEAYVGRQGNVVLANGRAHPIVELAPGGVHRFRFINAANGRFFRLALPGHVLWQVATDMGLQAHAQRVNDVLVVPGGRAEVLVYAPAALAQPLEWLSVPYDRGHGTGTLPAATVFQVRLADTPPLEPPVMPDTSTEIPSLPEPNMVRILRLQDSVTGGGHGATSPTTGPGFSINDTHTLELTAQQNMVEDWLLVNETHMDHPFHLHGFRFQVIKVDDQSPSTAAWLDTVNIPQQATVQIRMRLEPHPGKWMFHCHILTHAERGMMGVLNVAADRFRLD